MNALRSLTCWAMLGLTLTVALAGPPKTFQKLANSQWVSYEIRSDVEFEHAWNTVFDILITDFDLEMVLKNDGYLRTAWLHSYGGSYDHEYRVRVTVRFAPDHKKLRVKAEAQVKDGDRWITGVDSRLLATLRTDLMGTIGRTTR
jgi:hypothetical protein